MRHSVSSDISENPSRICKEGDRQATAAAIVLSTSHQRYMRSHMRRMLIRSPSPSRCSLATLLRSLAGGSLAVAGWRSLASLAGDRWRRWLVASVARPVVVLWSLADVSPAALVVVSWETSYYYKNFISGRTILFPSLWRLFDWLIDWLKREETISTNLTLTRQRYEIIWFYKTKAIRLNRSAVGFGDRMIFNDVLVNLLSIFATIYCMYRFRYRRWNISKN